MAKKDSNPKDALGIKKVPLHVVPVKPLLELGLAMMEGGRKYGSHNYREMGVLMSTYYDAAMRHLTAWWEGEDLDPDSGVPHVVKAIASLFVLRDSQHMGNCIDDRPIKYPGGINMSEFNEKAATIVDKYPVCIEPFIECHKCNVCTLTHERPSFGETVFDKIVKSEGEKLAKEYDFYLAHPFDSRHKLKVWAEDLEAKYGIKILNPFYDIEHQHFKEVESHQIDRFQYARLVNPTILVNKDLDGIYKCKALLANVTGDVSYGTLMEIVYAYIFNMPIYVIVVNRYEDHPWIRYHATKVFTSYSEFEVWLAENK